MRRYQRQSERYFGVLAESAHHTTPFTNYAELALSKGPLLALNVEWDAAGIYPDGMRCGHLRRYDAVLPLTGALQASALGAATDPHDPGTKSLPRYPLRGRLEPRGR